MAAGVLCAVRGIRNPHAGGVGLRGEAGAGRAGPARSEVISHGVQKVSVTLGPPPGFWGRSARLASEDQVWTRTLAARSWETQSQK